MLCYAFGALTACNYREHCILHLP